MLSLIIAILAIVFALIAVALLVWIIRGSMGAAKMAIVSAVAALLFGLATNALTYFVFKEADKPSDVVKLDRVSAESAGGVPFTLNGTATVSEDDTLWIIVYRPSGGYEITSRTPVAVAADGTWIFSPIAVGRSGPTPDAPSPDAGAQYTVAAVVLDKTGTEDFRKQISSAANPMDVFVNDAGPSDVLARDTARIQVK